MRKYTFFLFFFVVGAFLANDVKAQKKEFSFEQAFLFGGERITQGVPSIEGWFDDEWYLQRVIDEDGARIEKVHVLSEEREVFFDFDAYVADLPAGYDLSRADEHTKDYTKFLFNRGNDLFCFDTDSKSLKQLTTNEEKEVNPTLSPDGKSVAFTRDNNLYVVDMETGEEKQLTNDGSEVILNGYASWVYYEEILGRSSRYKAFWWSPDGSEIAFLRFDDTPVPIYSLYDPIGQHGTWIDWRYPKVGDPNPIVKLGVVDITTSDTKWIISTEKQDRYIAFPKWMPDSKHFFYQDVNRGQDSVRIYKVNAESGEQKLVYDEYQKTWVEFFPDLTVLENGEGFIVRTDKDGFWNLYLYDADGNFIRTITKGENAVDKILHIDYENDEIYYLAFGEETYETQLYKVAFDGSDVEMITNEPGTHSANVSPTGKYFYDRYSSVTEPGIVTIKNGDGEIVKELGTRATELMNEYDLGTFEFFTIPTEDGYALPAVWCLPSDFDSTKTYPVIFSIYGGPGAMTVSNSYKRLESHYWAQHGVIQITVDHRGSGHFGKKGMDELHRNLGKWEIDDLVTAVKYLRTKPFIDSTKIGIDGGSYGGYVVLMALARAPEYFTHGTALYSVADWRLYDNVYTERFMDTYEENPEGYEFGMVNTHIENMTGKLYIMYGTQDENVHPQNSLQVMNRLQDLDIPFQVMPYVNAHHGARFPKYKHVMREVVNFYSTNYFDEEFIQK